MHRGSNKVMYAGLMTTNQFGRALADLGLTQEAAAELLGLGERTVTGYAGGRSIPAPVAILINPLHRIARQRAGIASRGARAAARDAGGWFSR
jgi:hypothetical protein